jgi:hypothetical protein
MDVPSPLLGTNLPAGQSRAIVTPLCRITKTKLFLRVLPGSDSPAGCTQPDCIYDLSNFPIS